MRIFDFFDVLAMTEEQDPPSFKAARRKDREMLAELEQDENLEKVGSNNKVRKEKISVAGFLFDNSLDNLLIYTAHESRNPKILCRSL